MAINEALRLNDGLKRIIQRYMEKADADSKTANPLMDMSMIRKSRSGITSITSVSNSISHFQATPRNNWRNTVRRKKQARLKNPITYSVTSLQGGWQSKSRRKAATSTMSTMQEKLSKCVASKNRRRYYDGKDEHYLNNCLC